MEAAELDLDTWMAINTFECPRGMGRLSPEACAELRNRQPLNKVGGKPHPQGREKHYRPGVCSQCTEYQRFWDEVARRRDGDHRQQEDEDMGTIIDCLGCEAMDVENQGRGLCKQCYPKTPASERDEYDLETAKSRCEARLEAENSLDLGGGLQLEPTSGDGQQGQEKAEVFEREGEVDASDDPLAGYTLVSASPQDRNSRLVRVDKSGKQLGFGAEVVRQHGLQYGGYVHLYLGERGLAIRLLDDYDEEAYRLTHDGGPNRSHYKKLNIYVSRLARQGYVRPYQRFRARAHESGKILFLDPID